MQKDSLQLKRKDYRWTKLKFGTGIKQKSESGHNFISLNSEFFQVTLSGLDKSEMEECTNTQYSQLYDFAFTDPSIWDGSSPSCTPLPIRILVIFLDHV